MLAVIFFFQSDRLLQYPFVDYVGAGPFLVSSFLALLSYPFLAPCLLSCLLVW